ncbi:unnamed protein product [Clavelina lepadiformis]|uniref:Translocation protein SEC62 n=1 Tax=Clavelina lepadiformis TaxID=159417 RepID=A0ABP0EWX0_CLALP
MESNWAKRSKKQDPVFQTRDDAVRFMETLLQNGMLYRAMKVLKESKTSKDTKTSKDEKKSKAPKNEDDGKSTPKPRKRKKQKEEEKEKTEEKKDDKEPQKAKKEKDGEKKKKKKYKLEVHEEQIFMDSSDLYVWIYDPLTTRKKILGGLMVLGIIGATLFPLWPPSVRIGVYYLSVCGAVFVGAIMGMAVLRTFVFAIVWVVTFGKHQVWFLPNLLADVGFFESFKPFYTHEFSNPTKEKDKLSDSEDEGNRNEEGEENENEEAEPTVATDVGDVDDIGGEEPVTVAAESASDPDVAEQEDKSAEEVSDHSQNEDKSDGRDSSSDYEIINAKPEEVA